MTGRSILIGVVAGIIGLYLVVSAVAAFLLVYLLLHPKGPERRRTYEQVRQQLGEKDHIDYGWYDNAIKEPFILDCDGAAISGEFIPARNGTTEPDGDNRITTDVAAADSASPQRCVILVHGYSQNRMMAAAFAPVFYEAGYSLVLYDQRSFGQSGGSVCTFGEKERYDLLKVIEWTRQKLGADVFIGLHGESMGGTTVLEAAALDGKLGFVVSDCAPSDIRDYIGISIQTMFHLPRQPALFFAGVFARLMGVNIADVSPRSHIGSITTPILFIHGEADTNVPVSMAKELFAAGAGKDRPWRIALFPGADHSMSYVVDPERYRREVLEFIGQAEK